MSIPFRSLVPMASVHSVPRSVEFYTRLGFTVLNTFQDEDAPEPTWAWLESEGANFMVSKATEVVVAGQQAVLFYVYCDDVAAKKTELDAAGVTTGEITYPFYAPKGEFRVTDPDGYALFVTHV
jgi:uncharacterized glyoxalase superfamily protein PhnB